MLSIRTTPRRKYAAWGVFALALIIALFSVLSETEFNYWWVRFWDFPRTAIATLCALLLIAALAWLRGWARWFVTVLMVATIGYQIWRIMPYTPLYPVEVARISPEEVGEANCFKALSFNVYQHNEDYESVRELIGREKPDLLLLLETDRRWYRELGPLLRQYGEVRAEPLDNTYGMIFASNLPIEQSSVHYLVDTDTPSIFAVAKTRSGRRFQIVGLHPRPPQPGVDTEERDAEIAIAARYAAREEMPVITMGDFNDVAWSKTSQLCKRIGRYLDPRIGRGLYATFPASLPVFRWPLDHYFVSGDFVMADIDLHESAGSDHLPVSMRLCLEPRTGDALNEDAGPVTAEDRQDSSEAIAKGRQAEREEELEQQAEAAE